MNISPHQASNLTKFGKDDEPFKGITVEITNDLDVSIDIYDVFDPSEKDEKLRYEYTQLGTIEAKTTGRVTTKRAVSLLEAMYTGPIEKLHSLYYYQFPIKFMSGTHFSMDTEDTEPLKYTVTEDDLAAMILSFKFHKFAMANPNSALTTGLYQALRNKKPLEAVNDFFKSTEYFKNCTLSSWNGVMAWLTMFSSGWQGSYFLYETPPSPLTSDYKPTLIGTVNIISTDKANSAQFSTGSLDTDGNLQRPKTPHVSKVAMAGDGTMVSQPDAPQQLKLTPVWMSVAQTSTAKSNGDSSTSNSGVTTTYAIGPALSGTATNLSVVSTQRLMVQPGKKPNSKSASITSSHTFNTLCEVVGLIVGLGMGIELLEKRFFKKQTDPSDSSDSSADKDISDAFTENAESTDTKINGVADGYSKITTGQQGDVLTQSIADQGRNLDKQMTNLLDEGSTPSSAFEEAYNESGSKFKQAQEQINQSRDATSVEGAKSDIQGASADIFDAASSMKHTINDAGEQLADTESEALTDSAAALDTAKDQADALDNAQETHDQDLGDSDNDSGFNKEDPLVEADPIPDEI